MIEGWWSSFRSRLKDRRFWVVQVMVLGLSLGHTRLESAGSLRHAPDLYLLPISTYFVPVVYAGLNFGLEGALPTALWCVVLALPNLLLFHHGGERLGVAIQLSIMLVVAVMVARTVDRERRAKQDAQAAMGMAIRAQEEERQRLARELHDETIGDLLAVRSTLEAVPSRPGQAARLEVINDALVRSIDGMRRFAQALRPSLLDDLGLVPALESLLDDLAGRGGAKASLKLEGTPRPLDPDTELTIFRIAQEALHNVERHAQAEHATLRLSYGVHLLQMEISDDGRGFETRQVGRGSLGLAGMRERARLIGGRLAISSHPGSTRVDLEVSILASDGDMGEDSDR